VHEFVNDLERPIGTYLFGRRMYEVMRYWDTAPTGNREPSAEQEYAKIWQAADKIIYSKSLEDVSTARTRIEREFDPNAVQQLKAAAARDISVGGPTLAAQALKSGLVDERHLFLSPIVVGAGTPALPDNIRLELELLDEHRFGNGVVHLHCRVKA
jgi:dihydrofolate reductase